MEALASFAAQGIWGILGRRMPREWSALSSDESADKVATAKSLLLLCPGMGGVAGIARAIRIVSGWVCQWRTSHRGGVGLGRGPAVPCGKYVIR